MTRVKEKRRKRISPKKEERKGKTSTKAPEGNPRSSSFWRARCSFSAGGRPPSFSSPEQLQQAVQEYFQWVEDNPLYEYKTVGQYMGCVVSDRVPRMRPMTIGGLCLFLGVSNQTWTEYRRGTYGDEFSEICTQADGIIREQKFAGAAAGFFHYAIIARDLGLVDRTDITSGGNELKNQSVIVLPAKESL